MLHQKLSNSSNVQDLNTAESIQTLRSSAASLEQNITDNNAGRRVTITKKQRNNDLNTAESIQTLRSSAASLEQDDTDDNARRRTTITKKHRRKSRQSKLYLENPRASQYSKSLKVKRASRKSIASTIKDVQFKESSNYKKVIKSKAKAVETKAIDENDTTDKAIQTLTDNDFETISNVTSESDSLDALSWQTQSQSEYDQDFALKENFFDNIATIPNLEDISSASSSESEVIEVKKKQLPFEGIEDPGRFVDPITGEKFDSSEEFITASKQKARKRGSKSTLLTSKSTSAAALALNEIEELDELTVEDEELLQEFEQPSDDDMRLELDIEDDAAFEQELKAIDSLDKFLDENNLKQVTINDFNWEAKLREDTQRLMQQHTTDFLNEIINRVVDTAEYVDPAELLRSNLDKTKLFDEFRKNWLELEAERYVLLFLHRKTIEYFRHKRILRPLAEDNPDTVIQDMAIYKESLINLNMLLGKRVQVAATTSEKTALLQAQVNEMEANAKQAVEDCEELIRRVLIGDDTKRSKFKLVVNQLLEEMANLRNEISETRYLLIQKQHAFSILEEKLKKAQSISEDLHLMDFENVQSELLVLHKKLEERNGELSKLRWRCNTSMHIIGHLEEKQRMMLGNISIQKANLADLNEERLLLRRRVFDLKIDRSRVRNEIKQCSFQGGLLDKPALLFDYDATVIKVKQLRERIENYRIKQIEVETKLSTIHVRPTLRFTTNLNKL